MAQRSLFNRAVFSNSITYLPAWDIRSDQSSPTISWDGVTQIQLYVLSSIWNSAFVDSCMVFTGQVYSIPDDSGCRNYIQRITGVTQVNVAA